MKKTLVVLVTMLLLPGLVLLAGDKAKTKKGELTISTGKLVHWKDIQKVDFEKNPGKRQMKPIMNFKSPKRIVKKDKTEDKFVQKTFNGKKQTELDKGGEPLIPATDLDFGGMSLSANGAGWPPDTNGDVGLNYYIQTVNTSIGIYNKTTGAQISTTTFNAFFPAAVGSPCDGNNRGDPVVHFDPYAQRWILYDFAWNGTADGSYYSIAASQTSDPTGAWWTYCLHADTVLMNDYPKSGVWHDGIYITANMFIFSGSFQHTKIWILKKPDIYNGTLTVQSFTDNSYEAWSILPSNAKGTTPPPAGTPNYCFAMDANEYGGPAIDAIYWWRLSVDWSVPTYTWDGPYTMNTAAFGLTASRIPQPGTSTQLDSLYGRLMYPANYRKSPTEAVYLNHLCEYSGRRATRWYEIRINGTTPSIYQQGTYSPDGTNRWMGSIAGDKNGGIALGYSAASSSVYPAIRYTGRLAGDPLNTMPQGEGEIVAGTGSQTSYTRWGDYSGMSIDPVDDETFYYTTEYYTSTGTNWQTRVGAFKLTSAPDTTPPVISGVGSTPGDTTSLIEWTTDEGSDSEVLYGTSPGTYTGSESNASMVTSHAVTLTGLSTLTTYYYVVKSTDASSNTSTSSEYSFTTLDVVPEILLSATGYKVKGIQNVDLTWSGATGTDVKIYRDDVLIATTTNDGAYTDNIGVKGTGTYVYRVCETDDSVCSANETVVF